MLPSVSPRMSDSDDEPARIEVILEELRFATKEATALATRLTTCAIALRRERRILLQEMRDARAEVAEKKHRMNRS